MKILKKRWLRLLQRWLMFLGCLIIFWAAFGMFTWVAFAEGSRTLFPNGALGYRANIEWRTSYYGTFLRRRSLFEVYAQAGEVILLGSSAVGVANGDIRIYNPNTITGPIGDEIIPTTPDFSCATQRGATGNPNQGRITSRVQELAGPDTITDTVSASPGNDVPNGYIPCFYLVPTTGIYHVTFFGPAGGNSNQEINPTGQIDLSSPANFNAQQGTSVAAWDATVRSTLTSTTDINGRLFADYINQFTGGWPRPIYSSYFGLTRDGYLYKTEARGLDANGFLIYANSLGFLNSDGSPLYHDVVADPSIPGQQQNQLNVLQGGVNLALPTSLIFFNLPSPEAITAKNLPLTPIFPLLIDFNFRGTLGDNDTMIGAGGVFSFTSNITGSYQLIISRDGVDFSPDNPLNRLIRNSHTPGQSTITWDGLDNSGNPFPAGLNYSARLTLRAGEHHFPIIDAEASLDGGPTYTLLNPPEGNCPSLAGNPPSCNIGFYDDRGYISANGTTVGTPGIVLPGNNPPNPPSSDLLSGFDTTTNQRRFGDGGSEGFGDKKGLDIWTYYPSKAQLTTIDIYALNLAISKTDKGITTAPGQIITYTLDYSNTTTLDATGVVITEVVPLYTVFNQAASTPTIWSCADGSPAGTVCETSIGALAGNSAGSARFAVTVINTIPSTVTQIDNTAVIGDDKTRGVESLIDNSASEDTPLPTPPAPPPPPPAPPDNGGKDGSKDDRDSNNGDDGNGDDDRNSPPDYQPTPVPTPLATPDSAPPGIVPTSTLPVLLLPETGQREAQAWIILKQISVIVLIGTTLSVMLLWFTRMKR